MTPSPSALREKVARAIALGVIDPEHEARQAAADRQYAEHGHRYLQCADEVIAALSSSPPVAQQGWRPTHRHYKGGLYRWLGECTHSETEELLTLYEGVDGRKWVRPRAMFEETLPDGRPRFTPLPAPSSVVPGKTEGGDGG